MRIAYVSDAVYPYNKGGKEKRLFEISTRFVKMGHDVHIYTMHWWHTPETVRTENGVTLHAISKYYPLYSGNRRSIKEGILFSIACFKLIKESFDIIDVDHMPFFPLFTVKLVCLLRCKRMYGTWHEALSTAEWTNYMGAKGYLAAFIEALSIRLPYKITAASEHTKSLLAEQHNRTKRVSVVASGIDTDLIKKVKPSKEQCDVLYVGRLVKDKNIDKLIKAFSLVAKKNDIAQCVIIGHGVERDNLLKLINKNKTSGRIHLLDPLANDAEVYSYMKKARVFVLPSVREGFGIVALEALACGTPVITTNSPANAAKDLVVDGKTGSIVALDAKLIANAITYWLKNTNKSAELTISTVDYDWNLLAERQVKDYTL